MIVLHKSCSSFELDKKLSTPAVSSLFCSVPHPRYREPNKHCEYVLLSSSGCATILRSLKPRNALGAVYVGRLSYVKCHPFVVPVKLKVHLVGMLSGTKESSHARAF